VSTQADTKTHLDDVVGRSFGDMSLNLNADYGRQSGKQYWGLAGLARYSFFDDKFRISGRGEYFDDSDGAAGITNAAGARLLNKYWEGTLSLSVPASPNAEFRVEGRYDRTTDAKIFKDGAEQGKAPSRWPLSLGSKTSGSRSTCCPPRRSMLRGGGNNIGTDRSRDIGRLPVGRRRRALARSPRRRGARVRLHERSATDRCAIPGRTKARRTKASSPFAADGQVGPTAGISRPPSSAPSYPRCQDCSRSTMPTRHPAARTGTGARPC